MGEVLSLVTGPLAASGRSESDFPESPGSQILKGRVSVSFSGFKQIASGASLLKARSTLPRSAFNFVKATQQK